MPLLGLLLLVTGVTMNIIVLRRFAATGLTSQQVLRTRPWQTSLVLVALGVLLIALGHR